MLIYCLQVPQLSKNNTFIQPRICLLVIFLLYTGESNIGSTVINESELEGEGAKEFLEKVRSSLPQVESRVTSFG